MFGILLSVFFVIVGGWLAVVHFKRKTFIDDCLGWLWIVSSATNLGFLLYVFF